MRRALALILAVMMIISLTGCGSNSASSSKSASHSGSGEKIYANRLEEILARGYITVATEPYFAPNEFIDPSKKGDDRYQGSDIVFAKYIADELGVELKLVPLEFTAVLSSVSEGKYDLAISALGYLPSRAENMNLSDGYYFSSNFKGYGLMIRSEDADRIKTVEDLKDKVVIAQSGSLQETYVKQGIPEYKELKLYSSTNDGALALAEKKGDALAVAISWGELYLEQNSSSGLMIMPDFKFDVEQTGTVIGMKKGEDELTARINEIIKKVLDSGEYEKWYNEASEYAKTLGL